MTSSAGFAAVPLAAVAGWTVGAGTRRWLASLERGARVPLAWCGAGVGLAWAGVVTAWLAGLLPGPAVPLLLGLGWLTVAGSAVDVAAHRLPDALTLPALPGVLLAQMPLGNGAVVGGAVGAVALVGAYALVRLAARGAMGGGDVKLAGPVGAALGGTSWSAVVVGTVLAAGLTACLGLAYPGLAAARSRPAEPCSATGHVGEVGRGGPALRSGSGRRNASGARGGRGASRAWCGFRVSGEPGSGVSGGPGVPRGVAHRRTPVPHGPSMLVASLVVVAAASAWPGPGGIG